MQDCPGGLVEGNDAAGVVIDPKQVVAASLHRHPGKLIGSYAKGALTAVAVWCENASRMIVDVEDLRLVGDPGCHNAVGAEEQRCKIPVDVDAVRADCTHAGKVRRIDTKYIVYRLRISGRREASNRKLLGVLHREIDLAPGRDAHGAGWPGAVVIEQIVGVIGRGVADVAVEIVLDIVLYQFDVVAS